MALLRTVLNKIKSACKTHNINFSNIDLFNSDYINSNLPSILKQIATKQLIASKSTTAKTYQGKNLKLFATQSNQYLTPEVQAKAIGEALQFNIVITSVYMDRSNSTWCLHLEDENAPTIHLVKDADKFWAQTNSEFMQTNNHCIYNAIANSIQHIVNTKYYPITLNSYSIFKYGSKELEEIKNQTLINSAILTAIQHRLNHLQEAITTQNIPKQTQEQIAKDYANALRLVREQNNSQPKTDQNLTIKSC